MKINAPVKINISELKANVDPSVKVETIKADLKAEGAHVAGYRDEDGTIVMVISGDIDIETIEAVFDEDAQVDFNEFVIDDIELIDADTVEVFDNKNVKNSMKNSLSEKKKECCPPAPKKKSVMISLAEAFQGKKVSEKKVTLDNVIDSMAGHKLTESAAINAINKAKNEASDYYLMEKLGKDKYKLILESLEADKTSIHGNVKVNGKKIEEYTTDELVGLLEKVNRQINTLEEKVGMSLNETDTAKLNKELETKKKIQNILDEEISFREALKAIKEDDKSNLDFKDLNPDTVDKDKKDDESKEDEEKSDEEKDSKDEDKDDDDDKNPDEDEEVEIGNIIITLDSKKSAEELKNDLIDAGIPEDVIEIEPVEDNDEDEDEEKSDDSEDKENKEDSEENSEDEASNESVKVKAGKKINEDDSEESDEDEEKDEDKSDDEDSEDGDDEEETGSYKLILTDTDYAPQMSDVLQDIWGLTKEEFEEMIGGEIVAADDDEDSSDDKEKKDDSEDKSDESSDEDDSFEDFDPDEIFKDL